MAPVSYLRSLDPMLPRQVWLVQIGGVVNSFGNGMAFPFIVIYLHNVRGISFAEAGLALAVGGGAALAAGVGAGALGDPVGGRPNPPGGPPARNPAGPRFPPLPPPP